MSLQVPGTASLMGWNSSSCDMEMSKNRSYSLDGFRVYERYLEAVRVVPKEDGVVALFYISGRNDPLRIKYRGYTPGEVEEAFSPGK